jgi:hypothetical protein
MTRAVHGVIYGRVIQLTEERGLAAGQEVELFVKPIQSNSQRGEGLRRCAGALADEWSEEDNRILEAIQRERKRDSRRELSPWVFSAPRPRHAQEPARSDAA